MDFKNDPLGYAICDFSTEHFSENITVEADLCEDDILPVAYLFRTTEMMPELELKALELCQGKVLDVGAAAGCHAYVLQKKGMDVTAIDTSEGAVLHLKSLGIPAQHLDFFDCTGQYDTLLILMNGIGIAGTLKGLPRFLQQIKKLLAPAGVAICDSTDLTYLYEEEDGSVWVDLNAAYQGEMKFKMTYKGVESNWFDWLYIDFDLLQEYAEKEGLVCERILDGPSNNYLVTLKHQL